MLKAPVRLVHNTVSSISQLPQNIDQHGLVAGPVKTGVSIVSGVPKVGTNLAQDLYVSGVNLADEGYKSPTKIPRLLVGVNYPEIGNIVHIISINDDKKPYVKHIGKIVYVNGSNYKVKIKDDDDNSIELSRIYNNLSDQKVGNDIYVIE